MKRLLKYLKPFRKECILGPLFKLLEALFELFVPLVVASIIDEAIPSGESGLILRKCLLMTALGLIGMLAAITAQYFSAKAAVGFGASLRSALFSHIQKLPYSTVDSIGTSTLITRMTGDINQVQTGVNLSLRLLLRSPFIVFGTLVMAGTITPRAMWIFFGTILILALVVFGIMAVTTPRYKAVQKKLDRLVELTRENLTGVRVIRAFNQEDDELNTFRRENEQLSQMQNRVGRISGLMNPLTYVLVNTGLIFLIRFGALQVQFGTLTQGQVIALINYMSQILVELIKLANLIITISKALAGADRVADVLDIPTEFVSVEKSDIREDGALLRFEHVCLTYPGAGDEALTEINFSINEGQAVGIIGGTGSGKTSLVHLILRFFDVTKGRVLFNGRDVRTIPTDELRGQIGIVLQKAVLFKGTVRENLLWGNAQADESVLWEALEDAQAMEFIVEKGLDAVVEQEGQNFSGGQRQRLTIARALVRNPRLLILDDSTSALDYLTESKLRKALQKRSAHAALLIVSQRTASIRCADQIIVLDDGKIVGIGTHEELLISCPVYREIHQSQYDERKSTEGGLHE